MFIGLRYLRAKRRNQFVSFVSLASFLGITLGVFALIVVLSVLNGFEAELRQRILNLTAHAKVLPKQGELIDWVSAQELALEDQQVLGAAPFVSGEVLLANGSTLVGAQVRGVLPDAEPQVSDVGDRLLIGRLDELTPGRSHILLGRILALILNVDRGDTVNLMTVRAREDGQGVVPETFSFVVSGVFNAGQPEYDSGLAIMHLDDAAKVFGLSEGVSGVTLKLDDMFAARELTEDLQTRLPDNLTTSNWTLENTTYFKAVKTEKIAIAIVLFLIVAVAVFNIVATLIMVVQDKQSDIAVLRTLGLKPGSIMGVFVVQGLIVGVIGTAIGLILGVLLALNTSTVFPVIENLLGFKLFPADVFYISELPSEVRWSDVMIVGSAAFLLSALSTLYPAWRASQVHPALALRYE